MVTLLIAMLDDSNLMPALLHSREANGVTGATFVASAGACRSRVRFSRLGLGACLGGNRTLAGAAANVVVANLAGKSGYPISFRHFLGYGLATTLMSLVLATGYAWLRYL